jgi:hypothetical protein
MGVLGDRALYRSILDFIWFPEIHVQCVRQRSSAMRGFGLGEGWVPPALGHGYRQNHGLSVDHGPLTRTRLRGCPRSFVRDRLPAAGAGPRFWADGPTPAVPTRRADGPTPKCPAHGPRPGFRPTGPQGEAFGLRAHPSAIGIRASRPGFRRTQRPPWRIGIRPEAAATRRCGRLPQSRRGDDSPPVDWRRAEFPWSPARQLDFFLCPQAGRIGQAGHGPDQISFFTDCPQYPAGCPQTI